MALFRKKKAADASPTPSQVDMMTAAGTPVFLSKLHANNPPRWLTVHTDRLESVTGLESEEYMDDASNHEVWSVDHFVSAFPFVAEFLNAARPGQTAQFAGQSGEYRLEDD